MLDIDLYVKYEGANPTGSFKDRGMVMAVTKAKEQGKKVVICASTGNTSASCICCRAGLKAIVVIPEGKIALVNYRKLLCMMLKLFLLKETLMRL